MEEIENMTEKEVEESPNEKFPIGTKIWVPCSGNRSIGNKNGHIGNIRICLGNNNFERKGWTTKEKALGQGNIELSGGSSVCPECKEAFSNTNNINEEKS